MRGNSVRDIGLGPALSKAIERFENRTGLSVEFTSDGEAARFGDERAEVIFRMTEEALRNVERHAGASRIKIGLHSGNGTHLKLLIEDNGAGFDSSALRPDHYGLIGLREQARLINADLQIDSRPNHGTSLSVLLRIAPEAL
jgi:signal transduction histidine kinase